MPIDASHALARMAWVAAHEPAAWAATAHVLAPKDFVLARLTGAVAADPIAAVGLVGADLALRRAADRPRRRRRPRGWRRSPTRSTRSAGCATACPAPACR